MPKWWCKVAKFAVERVMNLLRQSDGICAVKLVVNWEIYVELLGKKSQKFYLIDVNFLH